MGKEFEFEATVLLSGKTATGVIVPPEIVEGLGAGKKPKVIVVLNGFTYRNSISSMGGDFMLSISGEVREGAKVKAGDVVSVRVKVDTEERVVNVPEDLQKLLDANPSANEKFATLSYSNKLRHVLSIEGAKTSETRLRRLDKAISELIG